MKANSSCITLHIVSCITVTKSSKRSFPFLADLTKEQAEQAQFLLSILPS